MSESEQADLSVTDVYNMAVRLLARREHSELELRRKLQSRDAGKEQTDEAVAMLIGEGYLDDGRFAGEYVRMRAGKGYGPLRISMELSERGIEESLGQQKLDESGEDWEALANRVREKKFGKSLPGGWDERAKQSRFLQYRGFATDMISRLMKTD